MDSVEDLRVLANKYNAEILSAAQEPMSAQDLSDKVDIPIATSYRRIEELTEAGLLELEDNKLSDEGRRTKVYRSKVDKLEVEFRNGEVHVKFKERSEAKDHLADMWSDLKGER